LAAKDDVVVVGAGRLGRELAARLSAAGHRVVVVDQSQDALDKIRPEFTGFTIRDDARELSTLEQAKLASGTLVFAVTENDNLNMLVAQAAKHLFGVERVRARVSYPGRESLCAQFGILTVNPTALAAEACLAGLEEGSE
jgi:trk system potassium uptake protein TrkA